MGISASACTGCAACAQACGNGAIRMEFRDGFAVPVVNEADCISCGTCLSVCQVHSLPDLKQPQKTLLAICKNTGIYKASTSGGIFGGIAMWMLEQRDTVVCGAALLPDSSVKHIFVENKESLSILQGSKYVQSDTSGVFHKAKSILEAGKKLLFSGTPCQIAALKNYLGKEYPNLFTIDIVCHGVPSPELFREHVNANLSKGRTIQSISFRSKDRFERYGYHLHITFSDGTDELVFGTEDPYYRAFLEDLSLRESCYRCNYATLERTGDLTIGDCGDPDKHPSFHPGETFSTVYINTGKGKELWDEVGQLFDWEVAETEKEAMANESMHGAAARPEKRDAFYPCSADELNEKVSVTLGKVRLKTKLINRFRRVVPEKIRKPAKKP